MLFWSAKLPKTTKTLPSQVEFFCIVFGGDPMADIYPQDPIPPERPTPTTDPAVPPPPVGVFDAPPASPQARKTNWWLITLIVLLLLCCCCVVFVVFMYQVGGDWLIDNFNLNQFIR